METTYTDTTPRATLTSIPAEMLLSIADHLSAQDQISLAQTNRQLRETIHKNAHGLASNTIESEKARLRAPLQVPSYTGLSVAQAMRNHVKTFGLPSSRRHARTQSLVIAQEFFGKHLGGPRYVVDLGEKLVRYLFQVDNIHQKRGRPKATASCECMLCTVVQFYEQDFEDAVHSLTQRKWCRNQIATLAMSVYAKYRGRSGTRAEQVAFGQYWIRETLALVSKPLTTEQTQEALSVYEQEIMWRFCVSRDPPVGFATNLYLSAQQARRAFEDALGDTSGQSKRYGPAGPLNRAGLEVLRLKFVWRNAGSFALEDFLDAHGKLMLACVYEEMLVYPKTNVW